MRAVPISPAALDGFAASLNLPRDPRAVEARLRFLELVLESAVRLPGNQRVGLDAFIGLVPVVGDMISATIGTYLVWEARNLGMSRWQCTRMLGRVGFDTALGAIPFVGDVFDFFYRSNTRNVKALLAHIERTHASAVTLEGRVAR